MRAPGAQYIPISVQILQDYHDVAAYGEEEKRILAFVATQTALAIERKRAQQALQESEHKFRALFEGSSQGVMIQDEEKFLEVNSATLRILGRLWGALPVLILCSSRRCSMKQNSIKARRS